MLKRFYRSIWLFLLSIIAAFSVFACNSQGNDISNQSSSYPATENCRVVQHAIEETCVPNTPQRLVLLDYLTTSDAVVLGVKPIGIPGNYNEPHPYLEDKLDGIVRVGEVSQPNIESVLQLKPDLIIGWEQHQEPTYPLLSEIAPTVFHWQGFLNWRERFDFIAEVLGKQAEAQAAWAAYYQRMEELKLALGDAYKEQTISILEFCCDGIFLIKSDSPISSIVEDAGLQFEEALYDNPYEFVQISEEEFDKINGDVLFVTNFGDSDNSRIKRLQQKPLWQKIKAVQQNKVYFVDGQTWRGFDLLAANAVIDDLYKYLVTDQKQETSSAS